MKAWRAWMAKNMPNASTLDGNYVFAYSVATMMVETLKRCGDNLTRANVMKQAASFHNYGRRCCCPASRSTPARPTSIRSRRSSSPGSTRRPGTCSARSCTPRAPDRPTETRERPPARRPFSFQSLPDRAHPARSYRAHERARCARSNEHEKTRGGGQRLWINALRKEAPWALARPSRLRLPQECAGPLPILGVRSRDGAVWSRMTMPFLALQSASRSLRRRLCARRGAAGSERFESGVGVSRNSGPEGPPMPMPSASEPFNAWDGLGRGQRFAPATAWRPAARRDRPAGGAAPGGIRPC